MPANRILTALSPEAYERLRPDLEEVELNNGDVLVAPRDPVRYAYFPRSGVVSVVVLMADGGTAEAGLIGSEGATGISEILGTGIGTNQSVVQAPDTALRLRAEALRVEFGRGEMFHDYLVRFLHTLITQVEQTAACNRLHEITGRLGRWLLMVHDRVESDELQITHDAIARMLGTRRAGVTVALGKLEADGSIERKRGRIFICRRDLLEEVACECYTAVLGEYRRFMAALR